ncbi:MAG: M20/M25/M40 family metallo-hydrolase [Bryobacteraceae bacterium]
MNVFELTRALVDIDSVTPNEERIGLYLYDCLNLLTDRYQGVIERMEVEPGRFNVFARFGYRPIVTLSTHMDTVPPFFPSREDDERIWGRGACDTKGIIASMILAAESLLANNEREFGLLFVVGEERNSAGAYHASKNPRASQFLINGEPTGNRLAVGSKGALRYEIVARGKAAHSAYPELGDSAINKLIDALMRVRKVELPVDEVLGASTLNIGVISGGCAPNVIADEARAEIMIRLVGDSALTRESLQKAVAGGGNEAELREVLEIPALRLGSLPGIETTVVAYTTDIPAFGGMWGTPYLLGPGTIHVAHTLEENVPKAELVEAVQIYQNMIRYLKNG